MKTNRVTYFVLLAISIMLLTAGFVLYYPSVVGFGYPSLFFYTLGFAALIFSLFGLVFNKTINKHFCFKTFSLSALFSSVLVFTVFFIFLFYLNVEEFALIDSVDNPDFNYILSSNYLFRIFIESVSLIIFSALLLIATVFINIKIRKKHNLLKRGLFLDYGLAFPFGFAGAYCIYAMIYLLLIIF